MSTLGVIGAVGLKTRKSAEDFDNDKMETHRYWYSCLGKKCSHLIDIRQSGEEPYGA